MVFSCQLTALYLICVSNSVALVLTRVFVMRYIQWITWRGVIFAVSMQCMHRWSVTLLKI